MNFVSNIIWNSVEGFVEAGTRTAGGYAGDALIKTGDMIENYGRGVGSKVENAATRYGTGISGQAPAKSVGSLSKTPQPKKKPAGPVRSNSSPATTTTKKTSAGGYKAPGAASTAKKQAPGPKALPKAYPNNVPYPSSKAVGDAKSSISQMPKKPTTGPRALPKPYPNNVPYPQSKANNDKSKPPGNVNPVKDRNLNNELPKPYGNSSTYHGKYPGGDKKSAVRPGQKSSFESPDPKPYPGTSTYPGSEKKTAVRARKYKPMERMSGTAEKGKVEHVGIA